VAAACGGGGDDGGDSATTTTTTAGSGSDQTTTTTSSSNGDNAPGANTEFCDFDDDFGDALSSAFTLSPQSIEDAFQNTLQLANQAADAAPSEIQDEVNLLLSGFSDLVDALDDIDYDVINNFDAFENDPRVMALESAEYQAASDAIDDFCGNEPTDGVPPTIPGTDITVPDTDGTLPPGVVSGDLPDNFPPGLVPPGNVDVQTINAGGGFQVTFMTDASFDDVVAAYTAELGEPTTSIIVAGGSNASWFQTDGTIIVVQEAGDDVSVVVAGTN
jgi:hypothetical protein